jgi:hypothetical protein
VGKETCGIDEFAGAVALDHGNADRIGRRRAAGWKQADVAGQRLGRAVWLLCRKPRKVLDACEQGMPPRAVIWYVP